MEKKEIRIRLPKSFDVKTNMDGPTDITGIHILLRGKDGHNIAYTPF